MIQDLHIRSARPDDAAQLARIYVDTWRATYVGILPSDYLEQMSYQRTAHSMAGALSDKRMKLLIAEEKEQMAGYIAGGPDRAGDPIFEAEVYELYLLPAFQRRGTGTRLMAAMARLLHQHRQYSLKIWVLAANPARRFYRQRGGVLVSTRGIVFAGRRFKMEAYGWFDITSAALDH